MSLGSNLQALRKAKKISQEELAGELNISRQAIGKWESGTVYPDAERLVQISDYFGVSMDSLVKGNIEIESAIPACTKDAADAGKADKTADKEKEALDGKDGSPADTRNRTIRFVAALALIIISPFIPGEPGNGTIKSFLMLLCITGGIALLVYNHLSQKGKEDQSEKPPV